ncbi:MAG: putative porin [Pontiellaceae bacterium]|nr:putative porin [Pontiellaceae bacterium]
MLRQQLNELSAKIEQLETEQSGKSETGLIKNKAPGWSSDTKFTGDFMYIYLCQFVDSDSPETADQNRQRVRLRAGAFGKVTDRIDYGIRLATGGASAVNANQDIDGGSKKEVRFDQYYVDLHPELLHGMHLFMGKIPQPWLNRTGLIWDSDLNPEGIAAVCTGTSSNGLNLMANFGSFVIRENGSDDLRLWSAQVAGETELTGTTARLGLSGFYYQNEKNQGAVSGMTTGANTPGTGFNLIECFGSVDLKSPLPVNLTGQYVVNTEAAVRHNSAGLFGIMVGNAKSKGAWEAGYNYRITETDAVPDGFNEATFGGGRTGTKGHSILLKYCVTKNVFGQFAGSLATDTQNRRIDIYQLCVNFRF